jgi:hypothetical protein
MSSLLVESDRRMVAYREWLSRSSGAQRRLNPAARSHAHDTEGNVAGEQRRGGAL